MLCTSIGDWPESKHERVLAWRLVHQQAALTVKQAEDKTDKINQNLEKRWKQYVGCFCEPELTLEARSTLTLGRLESRALLYRKACVAAAEAAGDKLPNSWWWTTMKEMLGKAREAEAMVDDA